MNTAVKTQPTAATVSTYERLRQSYLEQHPRVDGELGLSVLLRHGLLAWMRTLTSLPKVTLTNPAPLDSERLPSPLRNDIIDVMVSMVTSASRSVQNGVLHT